MSHKLPIFEEIPKHLCSIEVVQEPEVIFRPLVCHYATGSETIAKPSTSNVVYNDPLERLQGGTVKEEEDDLDDELDDPDRKKKVTIVPPRKSSVRPSILTKKSRILWVLHYVKICILLLTWCTFTFFLIINKEKIIDKRLISIPGDVDKDYEIPTELNNEQLGVDIKGPFVNEDNSDSKDEQTTLYIYVQVQKVDAAGVRINLSQLWQVPIVDDRDLDTVKVVHKSHVFDLEGDTTIKDDLSRIYLNLDTNLNISLTVRIECNNSPIDKDKGIMYGACVLLFLYVMIIWEIIDRTFASIIAATMSIGILAQFNARPTLITIMSWIDVETLLLLFGMMILVAILAESGVFEYMAVYAYKIANGRIWPLITMLCMFTVVMSAFLDNVTMMLLVTPVTIRLSEVMSIDPVPILLCMVLYSNIGAATTPVGDPPNVIITTNRVISESGVNFVNFFMHMIPGVLFAMLQAYVQLRWKYRSITDLQMKESKEVQELRRAIRVWERAVASITSYSKDEDIVRETMEKKVDSLKQKLSEFLNTEQPAQSDYQATLESLALQYPIRNKTLLIKSIVAFGFVVALFLLHSVPNLHHLTLGWTALLGAVMLLILADMDDIEAILGRVEWSTLLFFASLFILMEALAEMGLIGVIGDYVQRMVLAVDPEQRLTLALIIIVWVSAVASAFLDNIPVVSMMVKIVVTLSQNKTLGLPLHPMVWALAFGCCFGGNGTLIGASANVICAGVAEQHGYKITFMRFFNVGFPLMISSSICATIYLLLAHVVFQWH